MLTGMRCILLSYHLSPMLIGLHIQTQTSLVYSGSYCTRNAIWAETGSKHNSYTRGMRHKDMNSPVKSSWFNTELWLIEKLSSSLRVNLLHKHDFPAPWFNPCVLLGRPTTATRNGFIESFCAINESPARSANNKTTPTASITWINKVTDEIISCITWSKIRECSG